MLTSSSRVRSIRSQTPTCTGLRGRVTVPVVMPSQVSRSRARRCPGAARAGRRPSHRAGESDVAFGFEAAAVLGAAEHERDRGGERGSVAGVSGAGGADPPCGPAVRAFRWKPGQPSPDDVGAGLTRAEQDRVLPDVGAERLGAALGVEGVGQPWHPSADRHQPQLAWLGTGPLG